MPQEHQSRSKFGFYDIAFVLCGLQRLTHQRDATRASLINPGIGHWIIPNVRTGPESDSLFHDHTVQPGAGTNCRATQDHGLLDFASVLNPDIPRNHRASDDRS